MPGVEFSAQATLVPLEFLIKNETTAVLVACTLKVPGSVTVKVLELVYSQLAAEEPLTMVKFFVTSPITGSTVISPSATKSVVAAMAGSAKNKAKTVNTRNFFIVILL